MAVFRVTFALGALFVAAQPGMAQEKSSVGSSEYYPLAIGTRWEYSTRAGKIVTEVTKHEEVGGAMCARIEAKLGNNKQSSEYIRVGEDGIYRYQANGQQISPPLKFLQLPFKEDDTWEVKSKTLGLTIQGTFTITKGMVTVPQGEYNDVLICTSNDFKIADKNVKHTYWFAKGVGIVKQTVNFGKHEMVLQLERFTPGNN